MRPNVQDGAARAKQLVSERKYQDAVRACRRLLLSKPDHVDVRVLLGQALLALGRHDETRIEMQALLKKSPLVAPAHRLLGEAYLRGRQPDQAASALKEALRLDPEDDEARELLDELGEVDELPPMETIERWFPGEPTRVEADTASTPATAPTSVAPPSVELSEDFRDEVTRTSEAQAPPADAARAPKQTLPGLTATTSPPRSSGPLPPPTSPQVAPPQPTIPPPPPGAGMPSAGPPPTPSASGSVAAPPPARPARAVKATLLGGFAFPAPSAVHGANSHDAPASHGPRSPGLDGADLHSADLHSADLHSADLHSADLHSADLHSADLQSVELAPASSEELALSDLMTGSEELAGLLPSVRPDPYDHLAQDPAPLEGEATDARRPLGEDDLEELDEELPGEPTRGRPPVQDGLSDHRDLFEAGLPELDAEPTRARGTVDFEDETTKGRDASDGALGVAAASRALGVVEPDGGVTAPRPRVTASLGGQAPGAASHRGQYEALTGLSGETELSGETTLARAAPHPARPHDFAPSNPSPPGSFRPSAAPGDFSPSAAPSPAHRPVSRPSIGVPVVSDDVAPPGSSTASPERARSTHDQRPATAHPIGAQMVHVGRWTLPLPTAVALAGIPVLVVVLVVVGVRSWLASEADEAIARATIAAQREGLAASLRRALELDADEASDEGPAVARRARLYAMATLDHGFEETERASALLSALDAEGAATQEAHVAATYLALEAGDLEAATERSMLVDGSALAGEAGHARARLAFVRGELERAETESRAVVAMAPDAPRHASLLARVLVARAKATEALTLLQPFERSPDASLARAEALLSLGRATEALEALSAMESELGSAVSHRQLVQRGRLRLLALVATAQIDSARAQLEESLGARPGGDEAFALDLVRAQLALGDVSSARELLTALPSPPARRAERGLLVAEAALAAGDLDATERALVEAGESPRTSFLRGRLAEARGQRDEARGHYRAAAQDARQHVRATARLGALALEVGNPRDAIGLLEALLADASTDAEVVSTLARAYLEAERRDDAARIVRAALAAKPDSLDLKLARAEIDLARGESAGALALLQQVIAQAASSARAQAMLGEAARREGRAELAADSFGRALELDPRQKTALLGRVYLGLDGDDATEAETALARARAQGAVSRELSTELEGRVQVAQGLGAVAVRTLSSIARRSRDASLLTTYARALAQSEDDRLAIRTFERAIAIDAGLVDAYLGLALSRTRRGDLSGASQAIGEAEGLVQRRSLGPTYEARLLAARGRILYENGSFDDAAGKAREALAKDSRCAAAHYVLAIVADARGTSPVEHLRRALASRAPLPEVLGQLVLFDGRAGDACELAERYLRAAPRGLDARDARRLRSRCR